MKPAMFTVNVYEGLYYPANKNATAVCAILSKMRLRKGDMMFVRKAGYEPILTNGDVIDRVSFEV